VVFDVDRKFGSTSCPVGKMQSFYFAEVLLILTLTASTY